MTAGVEAAAKAALDRRLDRTSRGPLAVAVSGGGDSMALLHLAADWAREAGRELRVLTVDHGLDPQSGGWAERVRDAASRRGLGCDILRWEGAKPPAGLPAAARAARHALLADAARLAGARVILLGHTRDDLFEAEAMRLAGSSVGDPGEWAPSPAWPQGRGVFLLRPLLNIPRESLRVFLQSRGETWIEDPANQDLRYARARARVSSGSAPGSAAAAPAAGPTPCRAGAEGADWGGIVFSGDIQPGSRQLAAAVLCASGGVVPPRGDKVERLSKRIAGRGPFSATLSGARVVREGRGLMFGRDPGRGGLPAIPACPGQALIWDGRFEVAADEAGMVVPLAGRAGRLSKAERLALQPVPAWARPALPVLETSSGAVRLLTQARPLALERLRAACGVYDVEAELPPV